MQTVTVKNVVLGQGLPKIIVSLMGNDIPTLIDEAMFYQFLDTDIIEFRADYLDQVHDLKHIKQATQEINAVLKKKPLLFTFRTAKEGGEKTISDRDYVAINHEICQSGLVDMIDIELFTGDDLVQSMINCAHQNGVKVILSNHDFQKTPPKDEMIARLIKMQELGADIAKIAVMPNHKSDVLTLLDATLEMTEQHATCPIITMSMAKDGIISRLTGQIFGSSATFGAVKTSSAPGQVNVNHLRHILKMLNTL